MSSATPTSGSRLLRRLAPAGVLRLGRPSDIWFKPALSVVVSQAPPALTLLALGRLDLVMYTMPGSLCALYAHNRPYRARARVLAWMVLGMVGGLALALLAASLTTDPWVLVTVGALMAAAQKTLCDAARIGPPGNVVLTFVTTGSLFVPERLEQLPGHVGLALAAAAWAWVVGMAPGLLRPYGPERRVTAQALRAAAAYAATRGTDEGHQRARATAAAAVRTAWQTLRAAGTRTPQRRALERLLIRAEVALAAPADTDPGPLRVWAHELSTARTVPPVLVGAAEADEDPLGAHTGPTGPHRPWRCRLAPLVPFVVRTALGCALAGYASVALGIGRPAWAVTTAAALHQVNLSHTWNRSIQRVVGNVVGVLVFAALSPLVHRSEVALVLCLLACAFGAEALISRNYWLGSVCVTPMALLVSEFGGSHPAGELIGERIADTLVGALVGFAAALVVVDRKAGHRVRQALTTADTAREHTVRLLAQERPEPAALDAARQRLADALVELRATADAASGEWWPRSLPQEQVMRTEEDGHRTLAATVRRLGLHAPEANTGSITEDAQP
ncbi:FUSC family protein [Streptomyces thermodiastaticus]